MTFRDRTARFQELRRLYRPHSIGIKDISSYLRSAATNITHRANAKFGKTKLAHKLKLGDAYNSDDDVDGHAHKSLLTHSTHSSTARDCDDNDTSASSSDEDHTVSTKTKTKKLPPNLMRALHHKPLWMDLLSSIDENIDIIEKQLGRLRHSHRERLRIKFDDDLYAEQDIEIEESTRNVTRLVYDCRDKLKQIGTSNNSKVDSIASQLRLNAMKSRAVKIQNLTTVFRRHQRMFLEKLKERELRSSKFFVASDGANASINGGTRRGIHALDLDLDRIEQGLTKQQLMELETLEQDCDRRTKEVINISKSVTELAQIFRDLSVLVVEQGSILDRIDYNVEQTFDRFKSSKKHIDKAAKYQKASTTTVVICMLFVVIAVCILILIFEHL